MTTPQFDSGNTPPASAQPIRSALTELDQVVRNATQDNSIQQHGSADMRLFGTHFSEAVRVLKGQKA
jgi:hypothetical protein